MPSGTRGELRFPKGNESQSVVLSPTKGLQNIADFNLFREGAWFFPEYLISRITSDSLKSNTLEIKRCSEGLLCVLSRPKSSSLDQDKYFTRIGGMILSVKPENYQLSQVEFSEHPEDKPNVSIATRITYSDFRPVAGHLIPFHLQEFVSNVLRLDIAITNCETNLTFSSSDLELR